MSESKLWASCWIALWRPHVLFGGPYPCPKCLKPYGPEESDDLF